MPTEPMTISEMLRNPQRRANGQLDEEFNSRVMCNAANLLEVKMPCEVWVEPGTLIAKGASLESLLSALQARM